MPHPADHALDRPALLAALRARAARLPPGAAALPAGDNLHLCEAIDQGLPGDGLARAGVHEILADDPGAATGFCALLLARAGGSVLWIAAEPDAWPPGLSRFGLSPADLVLVQAPRAEDAIWAMEEGLRCPGIAGALLALPELEPDAVRRLQCAAEAGGGIGLLLRRDRDAEDAAALTRWRVGALGGTGGAANDLGDPRWRLDLLRCRGGRPQSWQVVWRGAAERLEPDAAPEQDIAAPPSRTARRRGGQARAPERRNG